MQNVPFDVKSHKLFNDTSLDERARVLFGKISDIYGEEVYTGMIDDQLNLVMKIIVEQNRDEDLFREEYLKRLSKEIFFFIRTQDEIFWNYLLVWEDITREIRSRGLPSNIGRAQSPSSLLNYYLKITRVDPIKYGLMFENWVGYLKFPLIKYDYLNESRKTSKFDLKNYLEQKYNKTRTQYVEGKVLRVDSVELCLRKFFRRSYSGSFEINSLQDVFDYIKKERTKFPTYDGITSPEDEKQFFKHLLSQDSPFYKLVLQEPRATDFLFQNVGIRAEEARHPTVFFVSQYAEYLPHNVEINRNKSEMAEFEALRSMWYEMVTQEQVDTDPNPSLFDQWLNYSNPHHKLPLTPSKNIAKNHVNLSGIEDSILKGACLFAIARPAPLQNLQILTPSFRDERIDPVLKETGGMTLFQEQVIQIIANIMNIDLMKASYYYRLLMYGRRDETHEKIVNELILAAGEKGREIYQWIQSVNQSVMSKAHCISYALLDYHVFRWLEGNK